MKNALFYLVEKEFKQILRNSLLPKVFVIMPVVLVCIIPLVATQEVKGLRFSVVDNDRSTFSQRMIHKLEASSYFELTGIYTSYGRALSSVSSGEADLVVEIEHGFERNLITSGTGNVMISANAVNGMKAGLGQNYLLQIIADYAAELRSEAGMDGMQLQMAHFDVRPRYLFNTQLDYKLFMIPALMAMMLILIVGFLPALNIVGEKEKGTIEQMNVTPVGRFEFILSKMIPYWVIGLFMLSLAICLAWAVYGIVPAGSLWGIYLFASVFIMLVSSFGLIVSNYSETTQQAALMMFFFLVIFLLMSGLLTPVQSMPSWAQRITVLNPLKYYIESIRMLFIKGSGVADLLSRLLVLLFMTTVTWAWAIVSYRKNS